MPNHSYGNVFPLQLQFHENHNHFQMKGFAKELALKQRHKVTQKWPITQETATFCILRGLKFFRCLKQISFPMSVKVDSVWLKAVSV